MRFKGTVNIQIQAPEAVQPAVAEALKRALEELMASEFDGVEEHWIDLAADGSIVVLGLILDAPDESELDKITDAVIGISFERARRSLASSGGKLQLLGSGLVPA